MPTGLFHRDDGTWAEPTFPTTMESITADYASFGTVYVADSNRSNNCLPLMGPIIQRW